MEKTTSTSGWWLRKKKSYNSKNATIAYKWLWKMLFIPSGGCASFFKRQKSVRSFMHSIIMYTIRKRKEEIKSGRSLPPSFSLSVLMLIHRYSYLIFFIFLFFCVWSLSFSEWKPEPLSCWIIISSCYGTKSINNQHHATSWLCIFE